MDNWEHVPIRCVNFIITCKRWEAGQRAEGKVERWKSGYRKCNNYLPPCTLLLSEYVPSNTQCANDSDMYGNLTKRQGSSLEYVNRTNAVCMYAVVCYWGERENMPSDFLLVNLGWKEKSHWWKKHIWSTERRYPWSWYQCWSRVVSWHDRQHLREHFASDRDRDVPTYGAIDEPGNTPVWEKIPVCSLYFSRSTNGLEPLLPHLHLVRRPAGQGCRRSSPRLTPRSTAEVSCRRAWLVPRLLLLFRWKARYVWCKTKR